MKLRSNRTLLIAIGVVAAAAIVAVGIALAGGENTVSKPEYQAKVVNAKDRVDFALGRIARADSQEALLERMDEAAALTDDVAGDLDSLDVPTRFENTNDTLVEQLRQLAADIQGTADQARTPGFEDILQRASGLNFESWNAINAALADLRKKGIDVQPLARH